jgi:uncharacterized protein (TIGR03032 family)
MQLAQPFIQLPLRFDAERLAGEVAALPTAAWRPHPQGFPGNDAVPLIAVAGDPASDALNGPMQATPWLERMPYTRQVLAALCAVLGRTRLMRIAGEGEVVPHVDAHYYWRERVRVHVPVVTAPSVRFECGDQATHMAAGECWIFDTWRLHRVVNGSPDPRIHLVADTVGGHRFWELVAAGRVPGTASAGWLPRSLAFDPRADAPLRLERFNQPLVMSPWEWRHHADFLLAEVEGGAPPSAVALFAAVARHWRALWALHGPLPEGRAAFAGLRQRFLDRLPAAAGAARLRNGQPLAEAARALLAEPALDQGGEPPAVAGASSSRTVTAAASDTEQPAPRPPAPGRDAPSRDPQFDRPVFVLSAPRSGSSLLFETLAKAPALFTIGGESHVLIESLPGLHPAARGFASNALGASEASAEIREALRRGFLAALRDRDGRPPQALPLRMLEKTPKNALRVPFLLEAFPEARFIYLYRDPRETVASMIDAWNSGRFVTYPELPDWPGPPWSLLLVPGWRALAGRPVHEIAAAQWRIATETLLWELAQLPPWRWCVASYERLVVSPQAEVQRLAAFLGLDWDRELEAPLPLSRHSLGAPDPNKWRRHAEALKAVMPGLARAAAAARELFAEVPSERGGRPRALADRPLPSSEPLPADRQRFRSSHTQSLAELIGGLGGSLALTTYQSGRLVILRAEGERLNSHLRAFSSPMGLALGEHGLLLGARQEVWVFRNQPAAAEALREQRRADAVWLPRRCHVTGDIRVHEVFWQDAVPWVVNTRFSCLCALDGEHSFTPRWRPRFISRLAAEDRCHLNGVALADGRISVVSALGASDCAAGWREGKTSGGCLIDFASGEVAVSGLCMPHSPRWHAGRLWFLESGRGSLAVADLGRGTVETVAELPGFTRGLALVGPYAFVGLSKVREHLFDGIPLRARAEDRACGVWAVDTRSGAVLGFLRFEGEVEELFDLLWLPGQRWPELAEPGADLVSGAFQVPDAQLAEFEI